MKAPDAPASVEFRFWHPIEVRYSDLDPQRHVNHATYLTYMETARARYIEHLGLWGGEDFDELGMIVASAACDYQRAIVYNQRVRVGVRTTRLGNKSLEMAYLLQDESTGEELARGSTVMVAYDYVQERSKPIPQEWRDTISEFEGRAQ